MATTVVDVAAEANNNGEETSLWSKIRSFFNGSFLATEEDSEEVAVVFDPDFYSKITVCGASIKSRPE
jgi:hypothetical protein